MKKILNYLIIIVLFVLVGISYPNVYVEALNIVEMPTSVYTNMDKSSFSLNFSKLAKSDIEITNNKISLITSASGYYFAADVNNYNAVTYQSSNTEKPYLVKLYFRNVGTIAGRSVDAYLYVTRLKFSKFWTNGNHKPSSKKAIFMFVFGNTSVGNQYGTSETTYKYSADQEIDVTIDMIWSDTKETVELPFYTKQTDIDINHDKYSDKSLEAWKAGEGYSNDFYIYKGTYLTQTSGKWYKKASYDDTDGSNTHLKTGVYATTNNGRFSSTYYEGVCATSLVVTSQYINKDNFLNPEKESTITSSDSIEKESVDSTDDIVSYTINQKLPKKYETIYTPYKSFSIKDSIPNNLEYNSASVFLVNGNDSIDITNDSTYGTLVYDDTTKTVEYKFNEEWLALLDNYQGQQVLLNIDTNVVDSDSDYKNKANTFIDNIELISNEVVNTSILKSPTYEYISFDNDIDLPSEINVSSGDYKINDTNEYLIGEEVPRSDMVPVGTEYKVYNDKMEVSAIWKLVSYDKETDTMTDNNVKFTGTWKIDIISKPQPPTKNSVITDNEDKVNSINDEIEYVIKQPLGVFNKDVFRPYKNMIIEDNIPEGLEYKSAKVFIEKDTAAADITDNEDYGKLEYDSESKTIKYIVNENWIQDKNNYNGQLFKIVINTNVIDAYNDYNNEAITYINKDINNVEEIELKSNKIIDSAVLKVPKYTYISSDSNMKLPDEINPLTGKFKINNNKEYLNEEEVIRNNDIKVDTIYNVYDKKNNLIGYWKLIEWDKESAIMSDENVEFIAYWQYFEAPMNPNTGDNIYSFIILSFLSIIILLKGIFKLKNIKE